MGSPKVEPERTSFANATRGGSAGLTAIQLGLLVLGIAAFVWLLNIVALNGDILPDQAAALSPTAWVAITIPILALVFIGELLLFFSNASRRRPVRRPVSA